MDSLWIYMVNVSKDLSPGAQALRTKIMQDESLKDDWIERDRDDGWGTHYFMYLELKIVLDGLKEVKVEVSKELLRDTIRWFKEKYVVWQNDLWKLEEKNRFQSPILLDGLFSTSAPSGTVTIDDVRYVNMSVLPFFYMAAKAVVLGRAFEDESTDTEFAGSGEEISKDTIHVRTNVPTEDLQQIKKELNQAQDRIEDLERELSQLKVNVFSWMTNKPLALRHERPKTRKLV
eukprot:Gregarina_sp_Pseudo_9__4008@NODE_414_length_2884_cov_138_154657_g391_i0_p2_GENE_NODE_414_length_2884_cov_138_154657_g391_i0NODE_414_length_2884_cov_138_154657_g391_i0_p2_ORF_typecomplete_len232_score34_70Pox_A_type_inc/PF04508_12/3_7e02Pox_A_type_inc/PF04508_12/0_015DivIC/PF04977_15/0_012AIP3/PF03915_13/0_014WEMBL/PF05701_11/0_012DUF4140/PF13600_6/0_052PHM7_cyt/PF14703_6/14PHM7_cyt/PF14703_6/4_2TPR_MLP1_2/PF07926_12/0_06JAKMIP_CC3/PF16034_5/0_072Phage_HK97_TLTM/PF06120_11/7e03Phage_HK97_TLTM/PF0